MATPNTRAAALALKQLQEARRGGKVCSSYGWLRVIIFPSILYMIEDLLT